jgi:ribosomal protein S6
MYDKTSWDDEEPNMHNYSPNELAYLSQNNKEKYRKIVESNLSEGDSVEEWERRNLDRAKQYLNQQS